MVKVLLFLFMVAAFVFTCRGTTYMVGDTSGWDISSDFDSWADDKKFQVGDVLVFQYSSYHGVYEVSKDSFDGCNMTKPIMRGSNGNTTVALSAPGERYFVCGNRLHCLGGMKIRVDVGDDGRAPAPSPSASATSPPSRPGPSAVTNKPVSTFSTSAGFIYGGWASLFYSTMGILFCCLSM